MALTCFATAQDTEERIVVVPLGKPVKEAPLFYSATADVLAKVSLIQISSEQKIDFRILQGKPETLSSVLLGCPRRSRAARG